MSKAGNVSLTQIAQGPVEQVKFLELINNAETTYDVFRSLKAMAIAFGYEKFIIFRLPGDDQIGLSDIAITTNWDPELIRTYDAIGLISSSPMMDKLKHSVLPVHWDIDSLNDGRREEKQQIATELFKDFGLLNGICVSVSDKNGIRGAFDLSGSRVPFKVDELMQLSFIAGYAFEKLMNFEGVGSKTNDQLTNRERECVYWTAAGKTSGEVGIILGISENTVNHYLSAAALKLGAVNKAHTVAKALRLGILER